jgi:lysyl-tRNA synthetase class II
MLAKENDDNSYAEWCGKQAEHVAARQNHTDVGVLAIKKKSEKILTEGELSSEYDEDRADKIAQRLEKIEKRLAKIALVNIAKTIQNILMGCMEKMVDQLTDRVVERQCCQPSRPTAVPGSPSEILPGRTGRRQGRLSRPYSRRTECRPSSTVIGRLLFIFRRDPIEPNNVIQASECMKSWVQRA